MDDEIADLLRSQTFVARSLTEGASPNDSVGVGAQNSPVYGISEVELERSRETLIRKRISQTRHLLPITASTLGSDYHSVFRDYARNHHINGPDAIKKDAVDFAAWLGRHPRSILWIGQLARWESMRLTTEQSRLVEFLRLDWDFAAMSRLDEPPRRRRCLFCVLRLKRKTHVIHFFF